MTERFHKEVVVANFSQGKRIAQIVVKVKDSVGALAKVCSVISEQGADIRQSTSYSDPAGGFAVFTAFIVPPEGVELGALVEEVRKADSVLEAVAKEGEDSAVVDTMTFPVLFADQKVIVLSSGALVQMFGAIESVFGSGGSVIIYQQGRNYGKAMAGGLGKTLTRGYMIKNHLNGIQLVAAMGWGIPTVLSHNEALTQVRVKVEECTLCVKPARGPFAGFFVAGTFAGIYSFLSGKELQGKETKCVANGDPYCEFEIA